MTEIAGTRQLSHGGDWYGYQTEYGQAAIDYSVNINPLGMPDHVRTAIAEAAWRADRYPDPLCRRLSKAIGEAEGVSPGWILCGNGAADLIYRLSAAAAKELISVHALIPAPSFSEYESAVHAFGGTVAYYPLAVSDDFQIHEDILEHITEDTDLVFLCQPNNPTGMTIERWLLEKILCRCEKMQARLLIDECFIEFLDKPEDFKMTAALAAHPNLMILRAFTKSCAMAGVRLGYVLCSDAEVLASMRSCGQPWAVSILAEEAGLAALREQEYLVQMRQIVREERLFLKEMLGKLGFHVVDGKANFLLFRIPHPEEGTIRERAAAFQNNLKKQGIMIRSCANFSGLTEGWFRIAIRTREENEKLIRILQVLK